MAEREIVVRGLKETIHDEQPYIVCSMFIAMFVVFGLCAVNDMHQEETKRQAAAHKAEELKISLYKENYVVKDVEVGLPGKTVSAIGYQIKNEHSIEVVLRDGTRIEANTWSITK